jgi:diguanylate cyclase (GGDEF)-like protein
MNVEPLPGEEALAYLMAHAPVLFFRLSPEGRVMEANAYARHVVGGELAGKDFSALLVHFTKGLEAAGLAPDPPQGRLLNVQTASGLPQSYYFHFRKTAGGLLAFGRLDLDEIEKMRREVLALNQDLNLVTRQLHQKNAGLQRLNQELQAANEKILHLTRTDPLTELANRRHFDERIAELVSLSLRRSQPLSLIMTDIDRFKTVNDTFGHEAGDRVLAGYARLMTQHTRAEDLVARFGGEEFILLLPLTDRHQAHALAERIREALAGMDFLANGHRVTASFGISQLRSAEGIADFVRRADAALYEAKAAGRNRTVIAP